MLRKLGAACASEFSDFLFERLILAQAIDQLEPQSWSAMEQAGAAAEFSDLSFE